ncbi:cytochrome c oxidase subunit II [Roseomonas sp. JC162]|uniref:Cytochrome c oxidase subunit II n=1 Tax=Neoroseomonas marina TaxID=1232220 RepID=A0A848EDM2_9PROT|nr:cytochrome c oxidase subunit II [Neoroseomonas marina]NMJ41425.1 cytochrome c oxidase subunit II [Neoroseomonas marina]
MAVLLVLAGCGGDVSTLDPAGPSATSIAMMWSVMLIGATFITIVVLSLLALGFRRSVVPRRIPESLWLGYGAIGIVSVALIALLIYGFLVGGGQRPIGGPATTIRATAQQWHWHFSYEARAPTGAVLVMPVGHPVTVEVTATDVIHGFWIPRLGGKVDAIPGHVNRLRLQADRPGRFVGLCAEFCGTGHRDHSFTAIALSPADWRAFMDGASLEALGHD